MPEPSKQPDGLFLYVGPTQYALDSGPLALPPDVHALPPVGRGDIPALVAAHPPGSLAIADGVFHQRLPVGHAELREALRAGWRVWGLSSMGALRAVEMRTLGMRGFGAVYAQYEANPSLPDDEVALIHEPEPPYRALTEPMVHLSAALDALTEANLLRGDEAGVVAQILRGEWYGERTTARLFALIAQIAGPEADAAARRRLTSLDPFRIKAWDLAEFLRERPWQTGLGDGVMRL